MKKIDKIDFEWLRRRRWRKKLKRQEKGHVYTGDINIKGTVTYRIQQKIDDIILSRFENPLYKYLAESGFVDKVVTKVIFEETFSIEKDPDFAIEQLSQVTSSLEKGSNNLELDFSGCKYIDLHTIFVLRILVNDFRKNQQRLQRRLHTKDIITEIKIRPSLNDLVNKRLFAGGILSNVTVKVDQMMPISTIGIHEGDRTQDHYFENKKGATATKITNFVNNDCLRNYDCSLTEEGLSDMTSLISEILNNAEDHSLHNKWYATGTLFEENRIAKNPSIDVVGELNITILNFGPSFYEGLESTRLQNAETYQKLSTLYENIIHKTGGKAFTRENYFTLYALQDGVSRLKFERESRGTGTMKFINSFLKIGDYEDVKKDYVPCMSILTGQTLLKCDTKYKSFPIDNDYYLSLNNDKDLRVPPSKTHLLSLNRKFPGTILCVKIYFNKQHLINKINGNG